MINLFIILIVYLSIYLKINTEITEGKHVQCLQITIFKDHHPEFYY